MTDYTKATNFTAKDSLPSGNANKIVKGAEIDDEFDKIATAVATKSNIASPTFTGTVTGPTIVATTAFVPDAADGAALGTTSLEFSDLFLADGSIIYFGADQDTTITHVADTGLLINSTRQLQFGDSGTYIHQSADGVLDLVSDTEIEINATTIDMNGNLDLSGTLTMGSAAISEADIEQIDDLTAGTVTANKAVVVDSNKDIGSFRNITLTGELDAATLDISGNADIDGTLEADAITVDGTALNEYIADTVGAMVSSNTETNITVTYEDGDNTLDFVIGTLNQDTTGTADNITVSANNSTDETVYPIFVDGATGSQGAESDTGLTYNPSSGNLTIGGQLAAATLDISGNVDVDGTLEADAITVDGVTLAETIADTVGAMVSSNTESGITVSYEDADNTLDFTVGTLNQDTTGTADNFTVSANNSTDETVYPVFVDGATGSQGAETDTGLTYNPSTGLLTATGFSGNLTGTLQTAAQTNITSLGTLTALTGGTGDFNWDSNTLVVDSSANRVGILNAAPDVSLDIGSATDAVHVPSGTTAQRPTGAAGYFRYNSTTSQFEGYTDSWGAIGGGGGSAPVIDTMTGDNSDTTLALSSAPLNENATFVTFDGVMQHKSTYSVSGSTLTFSTAPPTGVEVECITLVSTSSTTANQLLDADSDTKIQVEESSDEDKIRFDIAGTEEMVMDATGIVINDGSNDRDFRIESNGDANMFFVDGTNNRIGIGTNSPDNLLHIKTTGSTPSIELEQDAGTSYKGLIKLAGNDLEIRGSSGVMEFYTGNNDGDSSTLRMTIAASGTVTFEHPIVVQSGATQGYYIENNAGNATTPRITNDANDHTVIRPGKSAGAVQFNNFANDAELGRLDDSGHFTLPLQPAFLANATTQNNIAVDSNVTVTFGTEVFDQNADFDTSTYTFTAPVTGRYYLSASIRIDNIDTAVVYYRVFIQTSNRYIYGDIVDAAKIFSSDALYMTMQAQSLTDMDAGDTAYVRVYQANGTAQSDIQSNSTFSGYLVA